MDNNPFATPSTGPNEHVQSGVQAVLFDPYGAYCFGVVRAPRPALLRAVEITVARSGEPEHVWGRPEEAIRAANLLTNNDPHGGDWIKFNKAPSAEGEGEGRGRRGGGRRRRA